MLSMKRDLETLQSREHDLLVVGGGIAGAWTVYEAATRGLKAALVEAEDFGQATSWSSLKTAHGGLRHLQRMDIAGFRESTVERRALLRVAPDIVRPLTFAIAAPGAVERAKYFLGGLVNDLLAFDRNEGVRSDRRIESSRVIDVATARSSCGDVFGGAPAFTWQDAQIVHTERLLIALLHEAVVSSAIVVNHCRVERITRGSEGFRVEATDTNGKQAVVLKSRSIVNAAGAALEKVAELAGERLRTPAMLRGVNVVLDRKRCPVAIGARDRDRFLFLVPWQEQSLLGTLYDDGRGPVAGLVNELIDAGRRAFPWADIRDESIRVTHSGHVPGQPNGEPIYRSRVIASPDAPIVSILSAKYTTARASAQRAVESLARARSWRLPDSVSATRPLSEALPLEGSLDDRLRRAQDAEMALGRAEAFRGRLAEGARGDLDPTQAGPHGA